MDTPVLDPEVITTARETAVAIQSDPRLAIVAYQKRLLIESLTREVEQINDRILANRQERAIWMNSIPEIAHRHANESEWCEEFDNAMAEAGLPRRRDMKETVTVYATLTARISVDVEDLIENDFDDYTVQDVDVTSVEVTLELDDGVEIEVEDVDRGECACSQVDSEPEGYELDFSDTGRSFNSEHPGASYTLSISSCTNCN